MRHYETLFILNPDITDEEKAQAIERYQAILVDNGAEILITDDWGRRKLAYEIKRFNKGNYVLFEYLAPSPALSEMERNMRLDDKVLRFLTVKKADEFDRAAFEARQTKAGTRPSEEEEERPEREKRREEREDESEEEDEDESRGRKDEDDEESEED